VCRGDRLAGFVMGEQVEVRAAFRREIDPSVTRGSRGLEGILTGGDGDALESYSVAGNSSKWNAQGSPIPLLDVPQTH
jgi:hypothetical protein